MNNIPQIPLVSCMDNLVEWLRINAKWFFDPIKNGINALVNSIVALLNLIPPFVFIIFIGILAFYFTKRFKGITLFSILGLFLIWNLALWKDMNLTLGIIIASAIIAIVIGIPLGILMSKNDAVEAIVLPVLDLMQTMPAFVYLIPAVSFFGIGMAPGVISSVIFAMPPVVRMTNLGIKQVPKDLIEAADSFGSTPSQKLFDIEIPIAKKTIMAGVNQTLMLTLSMVVVASMIGAPGLGNRIYIAVSRNEVGQGFAAGISVVILAIIIDRLTQASVKKTIYQ